MEWKTLNTLNDKAFRRMVGVKRETFMQMLTVITSHKTLHRKHPKRGRPPKLSVENQLLMMLMYYREYRTFFHTAGSYGMSEGQCFRIIVELEEILIQSGLFSLPGKKALLSSDHQWEVVLIDVSESSVERPKKNSGIITQAKRKDTL